MAGRDVCGRAPTGSGKTIAFAIPLIARVTKGTRRRPHGLVLVPTRELAAQVGRELRMVAGPQGPSIVTVYGGVGFDQQVKPLHKGVDIVVACPGRLSDLVRQGHVALDAVEMVVIDEADRMADMGFLPEVRRLLDQVTASRQTLLFSATLDGEIDVLVQRYQRSPVRHEVDGEAERRNHRHVFWRMARAQRVEVLTDVLAAAHARDRVLPYQARRRPVGEATRSQWCFGCGHARQPITVATDSGVGRVRRRSRRRTHRDRRRRARHSRRRRGRRRALRPACHRQGLRPPLGSHGPRRTTGTCRVLRRQRPTAGGGRAPTPARPRCCRPGSGCQHPPDVTRATALHQWAPTFAATRRPDHPARPAQTASSPPPLSRSAG